MPSAATRLLLKTLNYSGRGSVVYQLRDEFTTTASAPLTSPRTAEPGPGILTFVDTENKMSISGGALVSLAGKTVSAWGDPAFWGAAQTRVTGLALLASISIGSGNFAQFGWDTDQTGTGEIAAHCFYISSTGWLAGQAGNVQIVTVSVATAYQVALVLRSTGAFWFIKGGTFSSWTLLWVGTTENTATLYPSLQVYSIATTLDYCRVRQLAAPFTTDNGFATLNIASPPTATNYTGDADATILITLTAAGTILTNGGIRFRVVDASNYWIAYFNTVGAFRVDSVVAGTPTNQINVVAVIATSATRTVQIQIRSTSLSFYTLNSATWTQRGSTLTSSTHQSATGVRTDFGADWIAANLLDYPATSTATSAELDKV